MDVLRHREILAARRAALVEEWFAAALTSYPAHTARFIQREADRFRNPAGHALRENLAAVFDAVVLSDDWDRAERALYDLVRLRAVQDFTEAEAIGFIPPLRGIVHGAIRAGTGDQGSGATPLDERVERLMRLASAMYDQCRVRLTAIRVHEAKRRTWLVDRVNRRQA